MRPINQGPVSKGKFCDYCPCSNCQEGSKIMGSLPCEDGTNICECCYGEDPCGMGCQGGYPDQPCEHKPKLKKDKD